MTLTSPRLCLAVDSLDIGGAERHVIDLARGLDGRGWVVTIACSAAGPLSEHLGGTSVRIRPLLGRLVKRAVSHEYAMEMRKLIREERPNIVHAHLFASEAAAAIATLGTRVPLILTEHSEGRWQRCDDALTNRLFARQADHVIAVSDCIFRRLVTALRVDPARLSLIPNVVGPITHVDARVIPGVLPLDAPSGPVVGVVGRLRREKGHTVLLEAIKRVADAIPDVSLLVVGDGSLMPVLRARARTLGIGDRVHFVGEIASARRIIARLDVLVVPSLTEGTPLVVLEALSAGIPIIASRVGGIPDQIKCEEDGQLVPPGNPAALGEALVRILRDGSGPGGPCMRRPVATRTDDYDEMLCQTLEVYRRVQPACVGPRTDRVVATGDDLDP